MLVNAPKLANICLGKCGRKLLRVLGLLMVLTAGYAFYEMLMWETPNTVYEERIRYAEGNCTSASDDGKVKDVYLYKKYQLAFCPVVDIGSRFWRRVYLFFHYGEGVDKGRNMFFIPHDFPLFDTKLWTEKAKMNSTSGELLQNYTRFMFVEDPYARLWSAYLDKFYLPHFWNSHAISIVKSRDTHSRDSTLVGNDVQFREFLDYVTSFSLQNMDPNWLPIKYTCDPCKFKPHIIGKQETFDEDARHVLQGINADWVLDVYDADISAGEEIRSLTESNFNLLKDRGMRNLSNKIEVSVRLWKVLQLKGYMHLNVTAERVVETLVLEHQGEIDGDVLAYRALQERKRYPQEERYSWLQYKHEAFRIAYRDVPESMLHRIQKVYKDDFASFGYDPTSPWERITYAQMLLNGEV